MSFNLSQWASFFTVFFIAINSQAHILKCSAGTPTSGSEHVMFEVRVEPYSESQLTTRDWGRKNTPHTLVSQCQESSCDVSVSFFQDAKGEKSYGEHNFSVEFDLDEEGYIASSYFVSEYDKYGDRLSFSCQITLQDF